MNYLDVTAAYASGEWDWQQQLEQQRWETEMNEFRKMYEATGKHLKAADIKGRGDVAVVIDRWERVDFNDGPKLVIGFAGKEKTVVLNTTNYINIAEAYGDHPDGWKGKGLILYTEKTNFNGSIVDGLRVRPNVKATPKPEPPPQEQAGGADFDDDIPFRQHEHGWIV